jgi:hypothetical protein
MEYPPVDAINDKIEILKKEAIERCMQRILQATKKRDERLRDPGTRAKVYGITSGLKSRHGL